MHCKWAGVGLFFVLVMMGCGASDGPPTYAVTGTVTFDGEPVKDGQIIFIPLEEGLTPDAGPIHDGKYSILARPGEKKVQIEAIRNVPGKMIPRPAPMTGEDPATEMYIPESYNAKTTLKAVVTKNSSENQFNFALTADGNGI